MFGDNMERDYMPRPELERYDPRGIDDEEDFDLMSEGDRAVVEAQMRRRDREEGKKAIRILQALWITNNVPVVRLI